MKRIIYTREDGGVSIIIPSPDWEGTIEELAVKDVPDDIDYQIVDETDIPSDRTFRNAWKEGQGKPEVDMPKAREIHMGRIRIDRDKKLTELDKRNYGSEFDAERQTLRDIPQSFDLEIATTPDELKALWPGELT